MYITDGEEHDGMTLHIINKIGGCFRKKNTNRGRSNTNRKLVNFAVSRRFYKDVVFSFWLDSAGCWEATSNV